MTGTQNHECIAGTAAAIDYLASLSQPDFDNRRAALEKTFTAFMDYEHGLLDQLLEGLSQNSAETKVVE